MRCQAEPHVTGDLDWTTRTKITTQTAVQRETSATHSSSTRAPCFWHRQPAAASTDHLFHGRAKHDTRAERSLDAGALPSDRPVWHTRGAPCRSMQHSPLTSHSPQPRPASSRLAPSTPIISNFCGPAPVVIIPTRHLPHGSNRKKSRPGSENPLAEVIRFRAGPATEGQRRVPSCVDSYLYGPISVQKSASGWLGT